MPKQTLLGRGGNDLFVFAHIDPEAIRKEAEAVTTDTVAVELWGLGTSAYRPVLAAYGGWQSYCARLAKLRGLKRFRKTCITGWSAGGELAIQALVAWHRTGDPEDLPDAVVLLDAIYGSKPPGSKRGDGEIVWDGRLEAVTAYAIRAARGECILVLFCSAIATPYASSGECVAGIVSHVEEALGMPLPHDDSLVAADLEGRGFTDARAIGGLHVVTFPGRDAAEHIAEAHLFDRAWTRWIPWTGDDAPVTQPSGATPILRMGDKGPEVTAWQKRLTELGYPVSIDGNFGRETDAATRQLQDEAGIAVDGKVGPVTRGVADKLTTRVSTTAPTLPPPAPTFPALTSAQRDKLFGPLRYQPAPSAANPEGIRILGSWVADNIETVKLPWIKGLPGAPSNCIVSVHRLAKAPLVALFEAWERDGLLLLVMAWSGLWVPRFVRGRPGVLSAHAYGTAFDINAPWLPLGKPPPLDKHGTTVPLVARARELGWYWGGDFSSRPDPMHFELAVLRDP